MKNHTYNYPINEQMDVSVFNYFSTFTLGLMCYSFFNPGFVYDMSMFLAYSFAKTMITGYDVYSKYIYKPYRKHIRIPLMQILNIDDGLYEIEIVKDGNVIHSFKTMSDFIKNNPIKFILEDEDEDEDEEEESESCSDTRTEQTQTQTHIQQSHDIETSIDADLTNANVDIHQQDTTSETCNSEDNDVDSDDDDDDDEVDSDEADTDELNGDNLILNPTEYDFVLRTIYFDDDSLNVTLGFCLKYETFRKSDMKQKYTYEKLKGEVSKRRFIGIHLKTDGNDYIINLSNPVNYYIIDNTILDYSFLKMYLFKRYNVILGNNYTLSCIDNFIEMYTIEQGKKILIQKNSFKLVDDETFKIAEDDGDDGDDGSSAIPDYKTNIQISEFTNDADIEIVEYK